MILERNYHHSENLDQGGGGAERGSQGGHRITDRPRLGPHLSIHPSQGSREILEQPLAVSGLEGSLTLTRVPSDWPEVGEIELVPGGANIEVTDENKEEWLTAVLRHKLVISAESAAASFRQGLVNQKWKPYVTW